VSKKLLSFLLSELATVRIVCGACKTAVEISLDCLDKAPRPWKCHGCTAIHRPIDSNGGVRPDAFNDLADAIKRLNELKQATGLSCEFIVLDGPSPVGEATPKP
jgi:hypothetical protein